MSRRCAAGLALAGLIGSVALVSAPAASAAPATVYATGFEEASTEWFGRGSAQVALTTQEKRTGAQSLMVTGRTATSDGPALDALRFLPAGEYEVEAWVKLPAGAGSDLVTATAARTPNGGTTAYDTVAWQVPVSSEGWTKVAGKVVHATSNSSLELYLESPDPSQGFFVDDVTIVGEAAAPTGPGSRSDIRTDFESGPQGWGPRGDARVALTNPGRDGGSALAVTNRLQAWQGPALDVTAGLATGEAVRVSLWARLAPGQDDTSLTVSVQRDKGSATSYENVVSGVVTAGAWTQLAGTYTLGAPIDKAQIYVEGTEGVDFMIDDFSLTSFVETPIQDIPALKEVLGQAGIEHVGAAIDARETVGRPSQLFLRHFDAFTPENDGKPAEIQPTEGTFTFDDLDRLLDFADANDVDVYGHVLFWHSQTPDWFFQRDGQPLTSSPADQALLRDRMDAHVKAIADHIDARYPDGDSPIWAWDVVNEVIDDGDTANPHDMRDSRWFQVLGETFVDDAFRVADRYFPQQKLFINDYNTEMPTKRVDYLSLIEALQDRGAPIDGVGHQAHVDFARPIHWLDDSMTAVEELDPTLLQVITELDVSDSKENNGADVSNGTVPQHSPAMAPGDAETEVGYYYRDLFDMLETHADSLESVTFWGLNNARSWLRTWPAARPWEAPLPFDDDLQAAPAYWGIVDPSQLAPRPADVLAPRLGGHDDVAVTATDRTGARVQLVLPEAGDTRDGRLTPVCSPASGALFPVGTTRVTCTVTDAAGNTASRPTTFDVVVAAPVADLRAVVSGPATVEHNRSATYRVTVTNAGPSTAEQTTVVLGTTGLRKVDGGRTADSGTVTVAGAKVSGTRWTVPALKAGQSVTFTVRGDVSAKKGGQVTAIAAVTSRTPDPAGRDNVSRPVVTRVTR